MRMCDGARVLVCVRKCLLPFNCFPSNQRGHCQVADLLKAVISHLQSLTQLVWRCVILTLFIFSSFHSSVNSLPSLKATSFPLLSCSFPAAWSLYFPFVWLFLIFLCMIQTFFSVPQQCFSYQISVGRGLDLTRLKLVKTVSSNARFLAIFFVGLLLHSEIVVCLVLTLMRFLLLWFQAKTQRVLG